MACSVCFPSLFQIMPRSEEEHPDRRVYNHTRATGTWRQFTTGCFIWPSNYCSCLPASHSSNFYLQLTVVFWNNFSTFTTLCSLKKRPSEQSCNICCFFFFKMTIVCVQNPSLLVYVYVSSLVYPGIQCSGTRHSFWKIFILYCRKKKILNLRADMDRSKLDL